MKFSTDLIYRLSQGARSAELDGSEASLDVPPQVSPVLTLIGPQGRLTGFATDDIQRESFFHHAGLANLASELQEVSRIVTFGAGLWRVRVGLSSLSNFTQPSDGTSAGIQVLLNDPANNAKRLFQHYAVNGVPQQSLEVFDWLFVEDGFFLQLLILATGVAQTVEAEGRVSGSRLL